MMDRGQVDRLNRGGKHAQADIRISVTFPAFWLSALRQQAARRDIPVAQLIRELVEAGWDRQEAA